MTHDDYIEALLPNAGRLADAARGVPLDLPVPSCPDWTVHDLVGHLGVHHRWVAGNLDREQRSGMLPFSEVDRAPSGSAAIDWLEAGAGALAEKLAAVGPARPCWTWIDEHRSSFWARRTTHETAVHRWDGQNAAGTPEPIDACLAADGVDEYLAIVPFRFWAEQPRGGGETVHVHCTDTPGEWLVRLEHDGMHVTREHAKGDVAVRGTASAVSLFLMGRQQADAVEVIGDASLLRRWLEEARF